MFSLWFSFVVNKKFQELFSFFFFFFQDRPEIITLVRDRRLGLDLARGKTIADAAFVNPQNKHSFPTAIVFIYYVHSIIVFNVCFICTFILSTAFILFTQRLLYEIRLNKG